MACVWRRNGITMSTFAKYGVIASRPATDPDAIAFIQRADQLAGGPGGYPQLTSTDRIIVDRLIKDLKGLPNPSYATSNVWSRIKLLRPYMTNNVDIIGLNMKSPLANKATYPNGVAGYLATGGMVFNGTSTYENTNFNPTTEGFSFPGDGMLCIINMDSEPMAESTSSRSAFGAIQSPNRQLRLIPRQTIGVQATVYNAADISNRNISFPTITAGQKLGYWEFSANSIGTQRSLSRNRTLLDSNSYTATAYPDINLYVGAANFDNSPVQFCPVTINLFVVMTFSGLTNTDLDNVRNAFAAFLAAKGQA